MHHANHRWSFGHARVVRALVGAALAVAVGAACSDDSGSDTPRSPDPRPSSAPSPDAPGDGVPSPDAGQPGTAPGAGEPDTAPGAGEPGTSRPSTAPGAGTPGAAAPGGSPAPPGATGTGASPGSRGRPQSGPEVYTTYCQTCHGAEGRGDGPAAAPLDVKPRDFAEGSFKFDPDGDGTTGEIEDIVAVIRDGAARYGGSPTMVPWASLLDEAQLQAVAEHVKEFGRSS